MIRRILTQSSLIASVLLLSIAYEADGQPGSGTGNANGGNQADAPISGIELLIGGGAVVGLRKYWKGFKIKK